MKNFQAVINITSASHLLSNISQANATKFYVEFFKFVMDSYLTSSSKSVNRVRRNVTIVVNRGMQQQTAYSKTASVIYKRGKKSHISKVCYSKRVNLTECVEIPDDVIFRVATSRHNHIK